jgi:SAM-dependent methyltransferase
MLKTIEKQNGGLDDLLADKAGIQLDIGCGGNKAGPDFVGMDMRDLPGVDIVHNILDFPWPLPDESVIRAVCSHLVEHIPPHPPDSRIVSLVNLLINNGAITADDAQDYLGDWQDTTPRFIRFMDEVWRVMKPDGQFAIVCPHGYSPGQLQDPSHINASNETTWAYFDPLLEMQNYQMGMLWHIYKPKPWALANISYAPEANMEVLLRKRHDDYSFYES